MKDAAGVIFWVAGVMAIAEIFTGTDADSYIAAMLVLAAMSGEGEPVK